MSKELKGKLSISRFTGTKRNGISIELQDALSGVRLVRIEMQPEEFGNAVTGLGYQECSFELRGIHLAGMKHEYKTEFVPCETFIRREELTYAESLVKPLEVDGWKASLEDLFNHHRRTEGGYTVGFHRYVKPTE